MQAPRAGIIWKRSMRRGADSMAQAQSHETDAAQAEGAARVSGWRERSKRSDQEAVETEGTLALGVLIIFWVVFAFLL